MTALRTRRPTGAASWPRVLLSAEEGCNEAPWLAAEFSGDTRLITTYWLEINPGSTGDVYAAAPGADYELLDHDGTWADICGQMDAAWEIAREVAADGGPPSALVVHGMSTEWAMLSDLADLRARRRTAAELVNDGLDPAAAYSFDVKVTTDHDLWTMVGRRHRQMMGRILTWPGPVILTAREKRTAEGRLVLKTEWNLGFDVSAWVRLTRDDQPEIITLNTPRHGRYTTEQRAGLRSKFSLDRLIWTWFGCDATTPVPAVRVLDADQVMPGEEPPVRAVPAARVAGPRPVPPPTPPVAAAPRQQENAAPSGAVVLNLTDRWLGLDSREQVPALFAEMTAAGAAVEAADVAGLLTAEERASLGVAEGESLSLRELGTRAGRNVHQTGSALRSPRQAGAA